MKTDKFGDTIRRKLEGISPEFQESDWVGMQNYMRANVPSTFWQRYGSWIGYAAAASVTSLMAFGYIHQLNKNSELVSDVKVLKTQIEDVRRIANAAPTRDTVYIVQKEFVNQPAFSQLPYQSQELAKTVEQPQDISENSARNIEGNINTSVDEVAVKSKNDKSDNLDHHADNSGIRRELLSQNNIPLNKNRAEAYGESKKDINSSFNESSKPVIAQNSVQNSPVEMNFEPLNMNVPEPANTAYRMNYALRNRIAPRQVRKALHIPETSVSSQAVLAKNTTKTESAQKETSVTQTETVIPKLPIKTPYRFGAGMQFEKGIRGTTVVGEVLVGKKFSISTGLTWLKVKSMEFYNERVFREKNKQDFKRTHPEQVPQLVQVYNINVEPSSVQIPLTVAFRNTIANKVDYYVSAGTNITIKSNEKYSFDCVPMGPGPSIGFFNKSFENRKEISPINSVNLALGIEKSWHPIVLQAEGYLYTYFTPLSPMNNKTGPGFRIKLLYQIGKKY